MLQVVIPAWYSVDLSQEVLQLSLQAEQFVPAVIGDNLAIQGQLKVSKGAQHHLQSVTTITHVFMYPLEMTCASFWFYYGGKVM